MTHLATPYRYPQELVPPGTSFARGDVGISDTAEFEAVHALLSRHLIEGRVRFGPGAQRLGSSVELYVSTPLAGHAPIAGFVSERRVASNRAVARLKTSSGQPVNRRVLACWEGEKVRLSSLSSDDVPVFPLLPLGLIGQVIPATYWRAFLAMTRDDPATATKRATIALARQVASAAEAGTPVARATTSSTRAFLGRLFSDFVALREHPSGVFATWTAVPKVPLPASGYAEKDPGNGEPPRRLIRCAEQDLRADVRRRLKLSLEDVRPGDELDRVRALSSGQLVAAGLFHAIRAWALFRIIVLTAPRVESISRLTIGDWTHEGRTGYANGSTLVTHPGKNLADDEVALKPMSGLAGYPIDLLLAFVRGVHGEDLVDSDWPLIPAGMTEKRRLAPLGPSAITGFLGGVKNPPEPRLLERLREAAEKAGRDRGWLTVPVRGGFMDVLVYADGRVSVQRALIPFSAEDPFDGWTCHRYRAAEAQELKSALFRTYLVESNDQHDVDLFSEVHLVHSEGRPDGKTVKKAYTLTPAVAERMAGIAIDALYAIYCTDFGARKQPDSRRYEDTLVEFQGAQALKRRLKTKRADLRDRRRRGRITPEDYDVELDLIIERLEDTSEHIAAFKLEAERIESGELLIPADDRILDDAVPTVADLSEVRARVLGRPGELDRLRRARVRDWLTVAEFARALGRTPKCIGDWLRGELPPGVKLPWTFDRLPVEQLGPRRRRILVDLISNEWWEAYPKVRELVEDMLCDWPAQQNWHKHRDEHAKRPEWVIDATHEGPLAA